MPALQLVAVQAMEGKDRGAREVAIQQLAFLQHLPRALSAAAAAATEDSDLGESAAKMLASLNGVEAAPYVLALARSGPPRIRAAVFEHLGQWGSPIGADSSLPILRDAVKSPDLTVSQPAIAALTRYSSDGRELGLMFDSTSDPTLKRRIGEALRSCCVVEYGRRYVAVDLAAPAAAPAE